MDKATIKANAKKSLLDDIRSTTGYAVKQLKLALAILGILAWEPAPGKKTPTIMSGLAVKGFPEGYQPKDGEDMFKQFIACMKPMLEKKLAVAEKEETIANSEALETNMTKITDEMVDLFDQFIEKDSPARGNLIPFFNRISKDILNEVLREKLGN